MIVRANVLFLLLFMLGCKKDYHGMDNEEKQTITVDGFKRTYYVYTPVEYDANKAYPVIFALHGRFGRAKNTDKFTNFNPVADEEGYIVVYPQGYKRSWHDKRDTGPAAKAGVDDIQFFIKLVERIKQDYSVDENRIYAAGMSNGGFMSLTLACELSQTFAAVASVTGIMAPSPENYCTPDRKTPVLMIAGVDDPVVPYNGGNISDDSKTIGFPEALDFWANENMCTKKKVKEWEDKKEDGTHVVATTFTNCEDDSEVILLDVHGGGHTWPSGQQYLGERAIGKVSQEFRAEWEIVKFFAKHKLN